MHPCLFLSVYPPDEITEFLGPCTTNSLTKMAEMNKKIIKNWGTRILHRKEMNKEIKFLSDDFPLL